MSCLCSPVMAEIKPSSAAIRERKIVQKCCTVLELHRYKVSAQVRTGLWYCKYLDLLEIDGFDIECPVFRIGSRMLPYYYRRT